MKWRKSNVLFRLHSFIWHIDSVINRHIEVYFVCGICACRLIVAIGYRVGAHMEYGIEARGKNENEAENYSTVPDDEQKWTEVIVNRDRKTL